MSRRVIRSGGLFSLAGFLVGLTALHTRADSPLNFIPEDAVIVARVKNPAQMAAIPVSWVPEKFRPLTIGLLGPMLPLWRDDLGSAKEWWAVVYCEPAKQPTTVYILQSYDIEGAKKRHPHEGQLRIAEWQVLGDSAASAARLNECRAGRIKSLGATMESKVRQVFDNHSASLFVNAKRLRALYRTELDGFKNEISVAVEKSYRPDAASGLPGDKGNPGANPAKDRPPAPDVGWTISDRNAFEAAVETWHGVCHFLEEAGTGAVGLAIDDKGCELEAYVTVEPNSATDQFLARQPPSDMRALNRLPPGALLYFGISGKVTDFAKWLAQWRISNLEQTAKLKEALEKKRLSSVSAPVDGYFGSVDFGRDIAGPATSTLVISGSGAPNFREFENRLIELSGGSAKAHFPAPSNTTVKRNAEMISRHDVDVATMKLPDKPDAMTDVGGLALLKGYYGSSGFAETRTVTLPGLMAQTTGGGRLAMAQLIKNLESGSDPAPDLAWKDARMHAGDSANVIAMVDLPRCGLVLFRIFIAAFPGAPANVEKGEKFAQSLKPSYFVLAVATEVHAARCRIYLPREQVSGLFGLFEFITDGLGPGAAFDPAPKPARKESADVP